jgi:DNA-binding Lrp family transcriptional regulator
MTSSPVLLNDKTHVSRRPTGRPRKTSPAIDKKIAQLAESSLDPNAVDIAEELEKLNLVKVSPETIRRRLNEVNLHGIIKTTKPLLTKKHIKARLDLAGPLRIGRRSCSRTRQKSTLWVVMGRNGRGGDLLSLSNQDT